MPVDLVRDAAIDVLLRVLEGDAYLDLALDRTLKRREMSERGRRFMTQLVYGTVRHKLLCEHVLRRLVDQPLDKLPAPIRMILCMGVFQGLFCNQVTKPALVHTSVELAKRKGHAGTARLVNAVLRRCPTSIEEVRLPGSVEDLPAYLSVRYSLPSWLVDQWIAEFGPERAKALAEASCEEAPTTLRANCLVNTPDELLPHLEKAGVLCAKQTQIPGELTVLGGTPPARTKLFQRGAFLIQDAASMLPAHLMEPQAGERVLDLCAAPGGKTTHLAELAGGNLAIVAMDRRYGRLKLLRDNVERLGLTGIELVCGDGTAPPLRGAFDRVLVDAPCSGLGTLRRHPDLKWRMCPEKIAELAALQRDLLRSALDLCKNGGLVVYSVCTITSQETGDLIRTVLDSAAAQPEDGPEWLDKWKIATGQYRTLPERGMLDGFYLTRLRKQS